MRLAVHSATTLRRTRKELPLQRLPHAPPRESPRTHHATTIEGWRIRLARRLGHAPIVDARLHQQSRAADRAPRPTRSRSRRHPRAASNHAAFAGDRDWHRVRVRHAVEVVRMPAAIGNSAPKIACIQYPRAQRCRATIKAPRLPAPPSANHCRHPASIHSARC